MNSDYTPTIDPVLEAERERIEAHRAQRGIGKAPLTGLSFSGGGIRSASFALGLLQAFDKADLLRRIDYLSTVSGGGFIGASLTWFRRGGSPEFPFGVRGAGARLNLTRSSKVLAFLRQHGDYLNPSGGFDRESFRNRSTEHGDSSGASDSGGFARDTGARSRVHRGVPFLSLVGVTLRSAFLGTAIYGSMLVGAFFVLRILDRVLETLDPLLLGSLPSPLWQLVVGNLNAALLAAVALSTSLVIAWLAYPFITFVLHRRVIRNHKNAERNEYRAALFVQRLTGRILVGTLVALVLGSVPILSQFAAPMLSDVWERGIASLVAMSAGGLLGLSGFQSERKGTVESGTTFMKSLLGSARAYAAGFLLLYGLLLLSYQVATAIDNSGMVWVILPIVGMGLAAGSFANLNHVGISRMYRDRLMEAFMPGDRSVETNSWQPAVEANGALLADMCDADGPGPYHLLNANLIAVDSHDVRFRARGGDSFTLSPLFCGSDATGWAKTTAWMQNELTLATSMAISGAAANPNAGVGGQGATRNSFVSSVMSVLGLRLGYWAPNPNPAEGVPWRRYADFLVPGLSQGVFGRNVDEHAGFVELSDGGHFENLGAYELIRRRVEVIIVSDAGADLPYAFDGLATLSERVRVDFGARILFEDASFDIGSCLPGSSEDEAKAERYGLARRGFAVATIHYPRTDALEEKQGVLLYIKPTMVEDLPPDVLSFKLQYPEFPQQPTSDQFFTEAQFEAYRELGFRIGSDLATENAYREKQEIPVEQDPNRGAWL